MNGSSGGPRRGPAGVASAGNATRRGRALAVALLAAAAAAAAVGEGALPRIATAGATPAPLASPGTTAPAPRVALRVGTSGDYAPFSTLASDGTLTGFDVEVARAYARDRGRELELVRFRWPELESRLAAGEFDVAMSGVTVRPDRLVRAPMTAAVARADAVVLVRRGESHTGLAREGEGVTIAVNRGGHLERLARARLPRASILTVDENRSLPDRLRSGAVDAIVTDTLEASAFAQAGFDGEVAAVLARDRKAYWVRPGDAELAADLDDWLAAREADGSLGRLRAQFSIGEEKGTFLGARRAVDIAARRLALMPLVAEAKRARGLPIDAPGREAAIEAAARASAQRSGLDEEAYLELVRAQIEAAKGVQRAVLAVPPPDGAGSAAAGGAAPASGAASGAVALDLDRDLRPAIDALDAAMRTELVRSAPLGASPVEIASALAADAAVPGLDPAAAERIARALTGIPAVRSR